MALFTSTVVNRIDKKGRVSVPAPFRAALGESAHFYLFPHPRLRALDGNDETWMQELLTRMDALDLFSPEREQFEGLFADARRLQLDPEGRIMLPSDMLEFAGIADDVAFVGIGRSFQIWEPEHFRRHRAEQREQVARTGLSLRPAPGTGS